MSAIEHKNTARIAALEDASTLVFETLEQFRDRLNELERDSIAATWTKYDHLRGAVGQILGWPPPSFDAESLLARVNRIEGALRKALGEL